MAIQGQTNQASMGCGSLDTRTVTGKGVVSSGEGCHKVQRMAVRPGRARWKASGDLISTASMQYGGGESP